MDQQIKSDWVAALRSDRYSQAKDCFTRISAGGVEHCCLAVLTDLACEAKVDGIRRAEDYDMSGLYEFLADTGRWITHGSGALPEVVRRWAGLDRENPIILGVKAISRNDGYKPGDHGETYELIADAIESDPLL